MNICGVLIHSAPSSTAAVIEILRAIDGVDVHQQGHDGQIVVTVEDTDRTPAIDTLRHLPSIDGVVASSLIYHHFEPENPTTSLQVPPRLVKTKSWPGKSYA